MYLLGNQSIAGLPFMFGSDWGENRNSVFKNCGSILYCLFIFKSFVDIGGVLISISLDIDIDRGFVDIGGLLI